MTQGYLLLATGPEKYTEMARNAAASIRIMDGTRDVCLVHDEAHAERDGDDRLFQHKACMPTDTLYPHVMNKIRLFDYSPFQQTMFVDADCLLMKRDVQRWWNDCATEPVNFVGRKSTEGEWKGIDVATIIKQESAPYLVQINSGTFCFDDSAASRDFFHGLNDYYRTRHEALLITSHRGVLDQTDELYIALWLGLNGLGASKHRYGHDSWSNSTWGSFGFRFNPARNVSRFYKPTRYTMGIPNPLLGFEKLSPSFAHFVGLKPRTHYQRLAAYFREQIA